MYDPIERKLVINCDVQFVENEAWDGTVEKNLKVVLIVEHNDMMKKVFQTPHVSQNARALSTPKTLRHVSAQGTSRRIATQDMPTNTPRDQQTPLSSSARSESKNPIKKRSMNEIYDVGTPISILVFALFSQIDDPLTFEEVV